MYETWSVVISDLLLVRQMAPLWCSHYYITVAFCYLRACCEQVLFLATSVCLSVSLVYESVSRKYWKLLVRNWCNLIGIYPHGEHWKWFKVADIWPMTWELLSYFSSSGYTFWMASLTTLFSVWWYIFRMSRSWYSFKVMGLRSRSRQRKSRSLQLKNYWSTSGA